MKQATDPGVSIMFYAVSVVGSILLTAIITTFIIGRRRSKESDN